MPETDPKLAETLVGGEAGAAQHGKWQSADQTIDEYRLVRILGQGGMGVVWEAEHQSGGRRVALKLLAPNLPRTPETVERFLREARAAAALSHPRSTFVFGAGQFNGQPYIAMELMPGRTLQDEVRAEGALPVNRAVDHILDVIAGLEAAHALDLVHRDVKPSNCFFDSEGRIKVGDFGLSKSLVADAGLTRTGAFLGTPQFAAPEQVRGESVDQRTDVYAVGATLFYLLTAQAPFSGDAVAVIAQIASEQAPGIRTVRPELSHTLERVIAKALARDPNNRYGDLRQLRHALAPFASGGVSFADIGRRLAAYMIDSAAATMLGGMVGAIGATSLGFFADTPNYWESSEDLNLRFAGSPVDPLVQGGGQICQAVIMFLWFAISEGVWGQSLGKRILRLRVVDSFGETPSLPRAFLRAFIVPAAFGIPIWATGIMIWRGFVPTFTGGPLALLDASPYALWSYVGYVVVLLCLLTMRAKNGYRGVHDLLSGTRVLRLRDVAEANTLLVAAVAPVKADSEAAQSLFGVTPSRPPNTQPSWGPYRGVGVLGESGGEIVWLGKDDVLGRTAWILVPAPNGETGQVNGPPIALTEQRRRLDRPARQRWLQGNSEPATTWHAFEAVSGSPLGNYLRFNQRVGWRHGQRWLFELAEEFAAAERDGSLPPDVSFEHLWLDRTGRIKVLDAPLRWSKAASSTSETVEASDRSAEVSSPFAEAKHNDPKGAGAPSVALLASVAKSCCYETYMPRSARDFCDELRRRGDGTEKAPPQETLDWAAQTLRAAADRPTRIGWDDRLGMLCVSMGIELSPMMVAVMLLGWILAASLTLPIGVVVTLSLAAAIAFPAALGAIFRGGPVMRVLKVETLDSNGRPASRWRCALRNAIAWAPMLVPYALIGAAFAGPLAPLNETQDDAALGQLFSNPLILLLLVVSGCAMMIGGLVFVIGVIVALVRPQRGLQDAIAGTYLAPA